MTTTPCRQDKLWESSKSSQKFWETLFRCNSFYSNSDKHWFGYILGGVSTNSFGHSACLRALINKQEDNYFSAKVTELKQLLCATQDLSNSPMLQLYLLFFNYFKRKMFIKNLLMNCLLR
jgi:hypothetical protein